MTNQMTISPFLAIGWWRRILQIKRKKITRENKINGGEPLAFSNYEMGATLSDNYSYLDQNSDELSTKGEGGLRQMHSFATYNLKLIHIS